MVQLAFEMTRTPDDQKRHDLALFIAYKWTTSGRFTRDKASEASGYSVRSVTKILHENFGIRGNPGSSGDSDGYTLDDKEGSLPQEIISLLTPEDVERLAEMAHTFINEVTRANWGSERRW